MKKLFRSSTDKVLTGVLGGFGAYLGTDSTLLRVGFVFIVLVTGLFPGVFAYVIAAIVMPEAPSETETDV